MVESPAELGEFSEEDAGRWHALALTATTADIVGAARGTLTLATEYAKMREQYGATIGSYQAVGHLLAESLALIEGSRQRVCATPRGRSTNCPSSRPSKRAGWPRSIARVRR